MKRLLLLLVPVLAGLAAGTLVQGAKPDRIKDSHAVHAKNDVACETCHAAATSKAGTDNLLPAMEACQACHDVEDDTKCGQCHTNPEEPMAAPRIDAIARKFPHETHVGKGMKCESCHGETAEREPKIPGMAECRTCHETAADLADCAVCHAAEEKLVPVSHTKGWLSFHGVDARMDAADCRSCHTEQACQDCHAGENVRPRSHRLNFAFDHALEARGNEIACATCHESREFCASCHREKRILPRDHSRADWVGGRSGGRHAEEARLDMESCISCHESGADAPVCADCHGR
jgi:hypothetical protein